MKKGLEILAIILVGAGILIGSFLYIARDKTEEEINKYVNKNYKTLEVSAKNQLENKNIEFAISGKEGYYYSKNDKPMAHQNKDEDLIELGGNKYKWNNGITNKIRKHWYYYRVSK